MTALTKAGLVLGLGLGGFFDGIVLHQILGWHHLVCTTGTCQAETVAALKRQNTQDGFFHLATLMLTVAGVALLFRAARAPAPVWNGRALFGAILSGWGLFNLIEGFIDHQLLSLHHVRPGDPHQFAYDMAFLAGGVILVVVGRALSNPFFHSAGDAPSPSPRRS